MNALPIAPDSPWLAPLAGWSDLPFRLLSRGLGAAVCCTEMISAKGLVYGGRHTEELLASAPEDTPLVAQLFGAEPACLEQAVRLLQARGVVWFDLNMGCSVPKVTKTGSGAALLKDTEQALAAAGAVLRAAGRGRAGFKLRLGWEPGLGEAPYLRLGRELESMGAGWISLHPRYARQGFGGEADHSATARLAQALSVPVIASGDLFRAEDGLRVLAQTGAAAVMYARGALSDPAIFLRHAALLAGKTPPVRPRTPSIAKTAPRDVFGDGGAGDSILCQGSLRGQRPPQNDRTENAVRDPGACGKRELAAIIRRHAALARAYAPRGALLKMRTIVPRYVRHLDGAKALRKRLIRCTDWESLERILEEELD